MNFNLKIYTLIEYNIFHGHVFFKKFETLKSKFLNFEKRKTKLG
jgi:hypothetical protein